MKFSIIIPTYNEELDIRDTLENLKLLTYSDHEIIIVDDSTDSTPQIISEYISPNLRLIRPPLRRGRCEARNIGILDSNGEILVLLNADVHLPPHFLQQLLVHYNNGYDSVSIISHVSNTSQLFPRYVECLNLEKELSGIYHSRIKSQNGVFWTEGFSVRRECYYKTISSLPLFPLRLVRTLT